MRSMTQLRSQSMGLGSPSIGRSSAAVELARQHESVRAQIEAFAGGRLRVQRRRPQPERNAARGATPKRQPVRSIFSSAPTAVSAGIERHSASSASIQANVEPGASVSALFQSLSC
jgi:hypothetical protein